MMDSLAALRLQMEWGADEALGEHPRDHFASAAAPAASAAALAIPALTLAAPTLLTRPTPPAVAAPTAAARISADTLDTLHAALAAFDGCGLRATATHTVRPDGNPAAGLVLIAEAPGADDDRAGTAFAGTSGQTLDRVLNSAGLDRGALLLCHLVPWRPPGGRAPTEAEGRACLPFLLHLLDLVQPKRLVLLGAGPVRALTGGTEGIRRYRGRWTTATWPSLAGSGLAGSGLATPVPALPMLPPDQWLRSAAAKRDTWADLLTLRRALDPEG